MTSAKVTKESFLQSCDRHGKEVYGKLLEFACRRDMSINWGTKGFTVGVGEGPRRVLVCECYPPDFKNGGQTLYTWLRRKGGILTKTRAPEDAVDRLHYSALEIDFFETAGRQLKVRIDRRFDESEVDTLLAWCRSVEKAIIKHSRSAAE